MQNNQESEWIQDFKLGEALIEQKAERSEAKKITEVEFEKIKKQFSPNFREIWPLP